MKKLIALILCITLLFLSGCTDLGDPQTFEEYYKVFGDAVFINQSDNPHPQIDSVSMSDLVNKENTKNVDSVMEEVDYKYMGFPIYKDTYLEDVAMWIKTNESSGILSFEFYLRTGFPAEFFGDMYVDKIEGKYEYVRAHMGRDQYGNPTYVIDYLDFYFDGYGNVKDENGNSSTYTLSYDEGYPVATFTLTYTEEVNKVTKTIIRDYRCEFGNAKEIDYNNVRIHCTDRATGQVIMNWVFKYKGISNPVPEAELIDLIASVELNMESGEWNSFVLGSFEQGEDKAKRVKVQAGDYIFIKIVNNCAGAHRKKLSPMKIEINNTLFRSRDAEE